MAPSLTISRAIAAKAPNSGPKNTNTPTTVQNEPAGARAIATGETPAVTGEDGLRNLEVALRCLGEG